MCVSLLRMFKQPITICYQANSTYRLFYSCFVPGHKDIYLWTQRKEAARTDLQAVKNGLRMVCLYKHCHTKTCNTIIVHKNIKVATQAWQNSVPALCGGYSQTPCKSLASFLLNDWMSACLSLTQLYGNEYNYTL